MADIRNTGAGAGLVPHARTTPVRSEAVRAAQRAFFDAALAGAGTVSASAPKAVPTASAAPLSTEGPQPGRMARPGSLVDIKV